MRYFSELPREAVFSEMAALCRAATMACCGAKKYTSEKDEIPREKGTDVYSRLDRRGGFYLARLNDDLPFVWLLPEPSGGAAFDDVLAYDPEMVGLFRFLAIPNALRAMYFLTGRRGSMFFNRRTLVNELKIPEKNADRIIEGMLSLGLIWCAELNSGENGEKIYQYVADCYFVSFLVMARTLLYRPYSFDYSNQEPRDPFFTRDSYREVSDEGEKRQSCN
ncbi:MAG: hypothetical protein NC084_02900 [Bacteroides sp.]|nr:hypothetical protein [Eubacterium sp.]MCM1417464.1 hypothetical protein [Roseburia sp.]MCM1461644.1 hypothetical protein [Bacteroides sp.]